MNTDPKNPLFQLTVGDLIEVLKETFPALATSQTEEEKPAEGPTFKGRCLYGVASICEFLHISRKTYYNWYPWLKGAIKQSGRKPIMDAEYAMVLYDRNKSKMEEEK